MASSRLLKPGLLLVAALLIISGCTGPAETPAIIYVMPVGKRPD